MAKNKILLCLIWLYLLSCSNSVSNVSLTDTPPDVANSFTPDIVIPVEESQPDTIVSIIDIQPKSKTNKTADTTKIIQVIAPVINQREILKVIYTRQIGVRELTGNNDGKSVEVYLKSVGLGKGYPWCAAFVHFCLARAGIKNPITAWAPTSLNKNNLVWYQRKFIRKPKSGDVFSLYFPQMKRIAHTGYFDSDFNGTFYTSVEGNTNGGGARDGDGVYKRKRSYHATFAISSWIKD